MSDETDDVSTVPEELEKEARSMGWRPKEQFRGKEEDWVDAEEFVERGRKIMPILIANNERLRKDLSTREQKIGTLESEVETLKVTLNTLEKHWTTANQKAVETAKRQLKDQLKEAVEERDVDRELEIREQLDVIKEEERKQELLKKPERKEDDKKTPPGVDPELQAWYKEQKWLETDRKKAKQFTRMAEDLREELDEAGEVLTGVAFLDAVLERFEEQNRPPADKVEGTPTRGRPSQKSGRAFDRLPKEAKEACWADAEELVGAGKRYKDMKAWEDSYAKIYGED